MVGNMVLAKWFMYKSKDAKNYFLILIIIGILFILPMLVTFFITDSSQIKNLVSNFFIMTIIGIILLVIGLIGIYLTKNN